MQFFAALKIAASLKRVRNPFDITVQSLMREKQNSIELTRQKSLVQTSLKAALSLLMLLVPKCRFGRDFKPAPSGRVFRCSTNSANRTASLSSFCNKTVKLSTIVLWVAVVTYLSGALISFNFFEKPLPLKENHGNKLSLPTVFRSVVVRTSNLNISRCRLADYVKETY